MKNIKILGKNSGSIVMISDKDYRRLRDNKWYINSSGYVTDGKVYIHQLILPKKENVETEHRDGNRLNNQRENLRYATRSQNHANRHKIKETSSKYKGVAFKKDVFRKSPWRAMIGKDYHHYHLGYFKTESEAALAYNKKAIELYGEFAKLNNVF